MSVDRIMKATRIIVASVVLGLGLAAPLAGEPVRLGVDRGASRLAARVEATGHAFDAVVTDYEVDLRWDPNAEAIVSARLSFDFAAVKTGNARRDREMLKWLNHGEYPRAEFVLMELTRDATETLQARGRLKLHSVEREVVFPVQVTRIDRTIRVQGTAQIDHREWGLKQIRTFLVMTVDPTLAVAIDLRATVPEA